MRKYGTRRFLHLCTSKTPSTRRFMSDKGNCFHALEKCNGVKKHPKTNKKIKTRNRRLQHLHAIKKVNQTKLKGGAIPTTTSADSAKDAINVALQNTGRVLVQTAANAADKIATPFIESMGIDLNESTAQTMDRIVGPLETGVAVLKQPRVQKVMKEGLVVLVDDLKPAMNKLTADSVSLITNVAEDVAGPLIGIPRTLGNMADIAETGIELANKTMGNVSDMTNEISAAAKTATDAASDAANSASNLGNVASKSVAGVSNNLNNLKQIQQRSFDNSKRSMAQLTNTPIHNKTMSRQAGGSKRGNKKTRKQSIFQQLHAYF